MFTYLILLWVLHLKTSELIDWILLWSYIGTTSHCHEISQISRRKAIIRTNVDWFSTNFQQLRTQTLFFNQKVITVIHRNAVHIVVCKIAAILCVSGCKLWHFQTQMQSIQFDYFILKCQFSYMDLFYVALRPTHLDFVSQWPTFAMCRLPDT